MRASASGGLVSVCPITRHKPPAVNPDNRAPSRHRCSLKIYAKFSLASRPKGCFNAGGVSCSTYGGGRPGAADYEVMHRRQGALTIRLRTLAVQVALLAAVGGAHCSPYTGRLTYYTTGSGLAVYGKTWPTNGATWIEWTVSANSNGSWHYAYTFTTPGPGQGLSHIIIELSPNYPAADILNYSGPTGSTYLVGNQLPASGSPYMPEAMYGVRISPASGAGTPVTVFSFDSFHKPVWGDFYAKSGGSGATLPRAWNLGFTVNDTDPQAAAHNGSEAFHILRPDGVGTSYTPEPGTAALVLGGLVVLGLRRRFRNR